MKNMGFVALEVEVGCLATEQEHQGRGGFNFLVGPGPRFTSDGVFVVSMLSVFSDCPTEMVILRAVSKSCACLLEKKKMLLPQGS